MIDSKIIKKEKISLPNVSRETLMELEDYSQSILNTNRKINLISSKVGGAIPNLGKIRRRFLLFLHEI